MVSVSLIIPTYNEVKNLPLLVEELFTRIDRSKIDLELIIVDDNSPDGTGQVAEDLSKKFPIKIIHRSGKLGLGSAVREGFKASSRPCLGVMDADLSHDPIIINDLILGLEKYELTIGSRFGSASTVEQWVWWRKIISYCGVAITKCLTGVEDPLSGYFFFRRSVIAGVALSTSGYKILFEILVKGNFTTHHDYPYKFRIRRFSTSKLSAIEYWLFLKQIAGYTWYVLQRRLWKR